MHNEVAIILQAMRVLKRFPGKLLVDTVDIACRLRFELIDEYCRCSSIVDQIILTPTDSSSADYLLELDNALSLKVVRSSYQDILGRYALVASQADPSVLVRVMGNCSFINPTFLGQIIKKYQSDCDSYFFSNCAPAFYSGGPDVESCFREALFFIGSICYSCLAHVLSVAIVYVEIPSEIVSIISDCEAGVQDVDHLLVDPLCHADFSRLS